MTLKHSFVLGLDHHKTPVDIREQLARINASELLNSLATNTTNESMLLSTCNRYEIYGSSKEHNPNTKNDIISIISDKSGIKNSKLDDLLYFKTGENMLRHGFKVASSLESMVLGEPQILGQMKQAYANAKKQGTISTTLNKFCSSALHVGKQVRSTTSIAKHPVSVASIAVKTAQNIIGDIKNSSVILIGAGNMGIACAKHLKTAGVKNLTIINRNRLKAVDLASSLGAKTHDLMDLKTAIKNADIIISSTASKSPIIVPELINTNKQSPTFFIDLAIPRDIHPNIDKIKNCFIYDIDKLGELAKNGEKCRKSQVEKANLIIEHEVENFINWSEEQKNFHMVNMLRSNFEEIRAEVLTKYQTPEAEAATRLLLNKILHKPTCAIKSGTHNADDLAKTLETFFESGCTRHK